MVKDALQTVAHRNTGFRPVLRHRPLQVLEVELDVPRVATGMSSDGFLGLAEERTIPYRQGLSLRPSLLKPSGCPTFP